MSRTVVTSGYICLEEPRKTTQTWPGSWIRSHSCPDVTANTDERIELQIALQEALKWAQDAGVGYLSL